VEGQLLHQLIPRQAGPLEVREDRVPALVPIAVRAELVAVQQTRDVDLRRHGDGELVAFAAERHGGRPRRRQLGSSAELPPEHAAVCRGSGKQAGPTGRQSATPGTIDRAESRRPFAGALGPGDCHPPPGRVRCSVITLASTSAASMRLAICACSDWDSNATLPATINDTCPRSSACCTATGVSRTNK
jgi:hypothetical protein